jgi:hypothetical protein
VYPNLRVVTANENGEVAFNYSPTDTVKISCLGFKAVSILAISILNSEEIVLQPISFQLDEVRITQRQKTEWWGVGGNKSDLGTSVMPKGKMAIYIPNPDKKIGTINKLRYFLSGIIFTNEYKIPFRIHVYDVGEDGKPNKEMLPDLIMVQSKKRKWFEIDISQYQLNIPENGFFVAMEFLSETEYKYEYETTTYIQKDGSKKKGKSMINLVIGGKTTNDPIWSWFNFGKDWVRRKDFLNQDAQYRNIDFMMGAQVQY